MNTTKQQPMNAGVIGDPVEHSLSPLLYTRWIKKTGIHARYDKIHATPQAFEKTVKKCFSSPLFMGMNVTLPHKRAALALSDKASEAAQKTGAANLLVRKGEALYAENTDIEGFLGPLLNKGAKRDWRDRKIVVVGAGGAARATLVALMQLDPSEIVIINRTNEKAAGLVKAFGSGVRAERWSVRNDVLEGVALLVNASAAGMRGMEPLDIKLDKINANALVYDLVYAPTNTNLLKRAKAQGLSTLGGLDMLIGQAMPSFKAFFGINAPADKAIKSALIKAEARMRQ